MNPYIGHDTQYYGVEEHRLVGGKGDGMALFEVNNGYKDAGYARKKEYF